MFAKKKQSGYSVLASFILWATWGEYKTFVVLFRLIKDQAFLLFTWSVQPLLLDFVRPCLTPSSVGLQWMKIYLENENAHGLLKTNLLNTLVIKRKKERKEGRKERSELCRRESFKIGSAYFSPQNTSASISIPITSIAILMCDYWYVLLS